ncbi:hypothetical protein ABS768_17180 [Flavobacterium sp. ST-75]|uniref:Uncharacterized protein n=1 Tax=Flavobacterium rhizophilum TaxID=3163296 RepID=A0ABW8YGQ3_9FLAO
MKKESFSPKAFLNVKELTTQEDLMIRGGGKDKKKDQKKEKKKDADLDLDLDIDLGGVIRP